MPWNIQRGRYGAEVLTEKEIQELEASPESAAGHIAHQCNSCRRAARDQRAALEPLLRNLRDLLHVALVHGHAITLRPDLDSYDVTIEIHPERAPDAVDQTRRDVSIDMALRSFIEPPATLAEPSQIATAVPPVGRRTSLETTLRSRSTRSGRAHVDPLGAAELRAVLAAAPPWMATWRPCWSCGLGPGSEQAR